MIDFSMIQNFHFIRPYGFLIILLLAWQLRSFAQRDDTTSIWKKVMSKEILDHLTVAGNSHNLISPKRILALIFIPLCIVLTGPTWKQEASPFSEDKSVLIIALDLSSTMEQADVQPSRLLRAKQKIIELLELRGDSPTALLAYSGSAHTVMPVTNDRAMIRHFLDSLSKGIMPKQGKLPQTVIPLSRDLLEASTAPGTLLLVGDGATSETSRVFSEFFDKNAHQLIVWAIAAPEGKVIKAGIIPAQMEQLKTLAQTSHGRLVRMSNNKDDISQVNRYIENNLRTVDDQSRPWYDSGYPFTFFIAGFVLFWFRKGWTLQW